ncbi:MAG: hypothetical protein J4452_02140 [Candidatus Aenigmarchaeota archaeon]|nr:hypothetical protein [Candidatus Aenigmarchaeota archaeon]
MVEKSVEELYISSARNLRANFPKFVVFLGMAYIVWLIGTTFFIPLNKGQFLGAIEASRLDSIIILAAVVVLLFASFIEIGNVSDGVAGMIVAYILHGSTKIDDLRLRKMKRTFRTVFYIFPVTVAFLIFSNLLNDINPLTVTLWPIFVVIWTVIGAVMMTIVVGSEVEEAARAFTDKMKKKMNGKK